MNVPTVSALGKWDQDIVELLDRYGGARHSLFGGDIDYKDVTRSLVILEGIGAGLGMLKNNRRYSRQLTSCYKDLPFSKSIKETS